MLEKLKKFFEDEKEFRATKQAEIDAAESEAAEKLVDYVLTIARQNEFIHKVYVDGEAMKKILGRANGTAVFKKVETETKGQFKVNITGSSISVDIVAQ